MASWRKDRKFDAELQFHIESMTEQYVREGMKPEAAVRRARIEFGGLEQVKEEIRDVWAVRWLDNFLGDLRYAVRALLRRPGFLVVAVVSLGLGIGANTTIFSVVNGVLLQPLQFPAPGRLYVAENIPPRDAGLTRNFPVNARHFHEWRLHCHSCEDVALFQGANLTLLGAGEPVRLPALEVSYNFFRTLGIQPAIGRDFTSEEEGPNSDTVILTDILWRTRFAHDPSVMGRQIQLNGEPRTVIGIMPPDLHLPRGGQWGAFVGPGVQPLLFRPLTRDVARESPAGSLNYTSVVRLRPGVALQQANAELNALLADFVHSFQITTRIGLTPLQERMTQRDRGPLLLLMGLVGTVLLIVCVNIGNLMLVRTASRYREAGLPLALGASRWRLFELVLTEALLLVFIGGAAGLALAHVGLKLFVANAPVTVPRLDEVAVDWHVLVFAASSVAFCTLLCGLAPAWQLACIPPQESLKSGGGNTTEGGSRLWFREIMVGLEVALSTVSLVTAGLLMISFFRLVGVNKGFELAHVITQDVSFLSPKYSNAERSGFLEDVTGKLAALPGVQAVGAVSQLPLLGEEWVSGLRDPDEPKRPDQENVIANFRFVTPGYFKALGIPLRKGRFLEDRDRNHSSALISEQAAKDLWGDANPIGKHVQGAGPAKPPLEVVGVVGEVRSKLDNVPAMMVYEQFGRLQPSGMSFVVRTQADATFIAGGIRSILSATDPQMAISPARTMDQILAESVSARKFQMYLAAVFAISAALLASLGIYGVISFVVARRTPEMGIRLALGASSGRLVWMIVRQGMVPVAAGLSAGIVIALLIGRVIASQLFAIAPSDPFSIGCVAILLMTVALLACWMPARRAMKINPLTALRFE